MEIFAETSRAAAGTWIFRGDYELGRLVETGARLRYFAALGLFATCVEWALTGAPDGADLLQRVHGLKLARYVAGADFTAAHDVHLDHKMRAVLRDGGPGLAGLWLTILGCGNDVAVAFCTILASVALTSPGQRGFVSAIACLIVAWAFVGGAVARSRHDARAARWARDAFDQAVDVLVRGRVANAALGLGNVRVATVHRRAGLELEARRDRDEAEAVAARTPLAAAALIVWGLGGYGPALVRDTSLSPKDVILIA